MELRNGRTKIVVDPRTGSILRIEDCLTGQAHMDACRGGRNDQRLFRVIAPADSWWSCYADSQTQSQAECKADGRRININYPDLVAADGVQTGIAVRVEMKPAPDPDEILVVMKVENRGPRSIIDITFPLLGGWHDPDECGESLLALGGAHFISPHVFPTAAGNTYARNHQRSGWLYPVQLYSPWVDVSGPRGGLSYSNYMTESRNGCFWAENLAGYGNDFRLAMGWEHFLAVRPGESWTSPPMGLALHGGDWHKTADRYHAWFGKLYPPGESRPLVRSRMGFQNVFLRGFDGTPIRDLDTIPQVAAAGRKYGVDLLCVWDALTLGNYARHDPRDLTDYAQAERDTLRRGLKQAEAQGTRTCALINFRHPNVGLHLSEPDLPRRVQRRYDGTFRTENWTGSHNHGTLYVPHMGPESHVFSPFSPEHQERVLRLTRDYLDLGYSSMFYDQPFESSPDYGFVEQGHRPDTTHHAAVQLVAQVRQLLLCKDANAVIIGEECDILSTPWIDQWMSWSISDPSRLPEVAMMRYAMPRTILSWVVDHEPERATLAFALGMQLCLLVHGGEGTLEDEPQLGELIAAMGRLRRATAERTVMACFREQHGLEVDGDDGFQAYVFDSPSGPAVIVGAVGTAARGNVTVHRNAFSASGNRAAGKIYRMDGSQVAIGTESHDFALGQNEVAVWTL